LDEVETWEEELQLLEEEELDGEEIDESDEGNELEGKDYEEELEEKNNPEERIRAMIAQQH